MTNTSQSFQTAVSDLPECWPALPLESWNDTRTTLHMWTQIVGKVRLALTPMVNHWWNVPLYVNACGLTTSPIPYGDGIFEIQFDFRDHQLILRTERRAQSEQCRWPAIRCGFLPGIHGSAAFCWHRSENLEDAGRELRILSHSTRTALTRRTIPNMPRNSGRFSFPPSGYSPHFVRVLSANAARYTFFGAASILPSRGFQAGSRHHAAVRIRLRRKLIRTR